MDGLYILDVVNGLEGDIRLCLEALQHLYDRGRKLPGGGVKVTYSHI